MTGALAGMYAAVARPAAEGPGRRGHHRRQPARPDRRRRRHARRLAAALRLRPSGRSPASSPPASRSRRPPPTSAGGTPTTPWARRPTSTATCTSSSPSSTPRSARSSPTSVRSATRSPWWSWPSSAVASPVNGSGGLDHGRGQAMMVVGGGVSGGVKGAWPGLTDTDSGDVRVRQRLPGRAQRGARRPGCGPPTWAPCSPASTRRRRAGWASPRPDVRRRGRPRRPVGARWYRPNGRCGEGRTIGVSGRGTRRWSRPSGSRRPPGLVRRYGLVRRARRRAARPHPLLGADEPRLRAAQRRHPLPRDRPEHRRRHRATPTSSRSSSAHPTAFRPPLYPYAARWALQGLRHRRRGRSAAVAGARARRRRPRLPARAAHRRVAGGARHRPARRRLPAAGRQRHVPAHRAALAVADAGDAAPARPQRWVWAGVACGLLVLSRPSAQFIVVVVAVLGAVAAGVEAGAHVRRRHRLVVVALGACATGSRSARRCW